jgi:protease YdgD
MSWKLLMVASGLVALSLVAPLEQGLTRASRQSVLAQAQTSPDGNDPEVDSANQDEGVRSLSADEFSALNLSPELEALIPEDLGQSRHPQDVRGTIGEDDRIEMLSRRYPWSAIGRIVAETASGELGLCSGTLVAPDIVLTNAHCVMTSETGELHRSIAFQPNVVENGVRDLADVAMVEAVFYGTDFQDNPATPHPDDWAFLKLDQPLGDRYGTIPWLPLDLATLVEDYEADLVMVGYSGDYPREAPASSAGVHLGCSILGVYEESLTHDCDTFGGSSGGPILAWVESQPYIVGINSAEAVDTGTVIDTLTGTDGTESPIYEGIINFGVPIPRIVEFIANQP